MRSMEEIIQAILSASASYDVGKIYIFGSYARGEADELSDIDIAIEAPNLSLMQLSSLSYKIEKSLNLDVDLIPIDSMSDDFYTSIIKESVRVA